MIYLTIIAGLQSLVIVGLAVLGVHERRASAVVLADHALAAERERSMLLTRIQHPEFIPPPPRPAGEAPPMHASPPRDRAELAKVGTIAVQRPGT